jgi:hypothetical protein
VAELEAALGQYLLDGGELEILDPHHEIAGVALDLDPRDRSRVEGLLQRYEPGLGPLDAAVASVVRAWIEVRTLDDDLVDFAAAVVGAGEPVEVSDPDP